MPLASSVAAALWFRLGHELKADLERRNATYFRKWKWHDHQVPGMTGGGGDRPWRTSASALVHIP